MPRFSEDDYVDFCVLEALVVRGNNEQRAAEKEQEVAAWKKDAKSLVPAARGGSRF